MSALPISARNATHAGSAGTQTSLHHRDIAVAAHRSEDTIAEPAARASRSLRDVARAALVRSLLAHVPAADRTAATTAIPAIIDAARRSGSTDPNQLGYLLATAQTESDFGANMVETGHSKEWFNTTYGREDGNRPGTNDGFAYRGRGYVQTTHAGRYAELSHRLALADVPAVSDGRPILDSRGKPKLEAALIADPDRLTQPKLAAEALVVGVKHNLFTHNAAAAIDKTIPAGRKPGDVDFYHARGIVNGIVKDQAQAVASHAKTYAEILSGYRHSALGIAAAK